MDLHLHLDGSLSPASVQELAALQGIAIDPDEASLKKRLQVEPDCRNLNEYLEKFDFPLSLLQTEEALTLAVKNLCRELKAQGLFYAEIRFAPQLHTQKGLTQQQIIEAAIAGLPRDGDFRACLILCCMRGSDNGEQNRRTILLAPEYLGKGVGAVDLAGAEALFPTKHYGKLFHLVQELGLPYTIHAGEADGPDSVWAALSFGAKRLGHGVRSVEDEDLLERLSQGDVLLELCPTSNLQTCIFPDMAQYPIRKFMELGIPFWINTDNMTVSGTTLQKEVELVQKQFSLCEEEWKQLLTNAVPFLFADEETKAWLLEKAAL